MNDIKPVPNAQMTSYMKPAVQFGRHVARSYSYILENTIQPFAPGDVFLGCTYLNDPTDDHAGLGRILQYDKDLKPKGVLWTEGHRHLIIGLTFDPSGVLWGFDIHGQVVVRVDRYGRQMPPHKFIDRAFGAAVFGRDGSIYMGECLKGTIPYWGSLMTFIPGTNRIGDGHIFKFNAAFDCVAEYKTQTCVELSGFKGVTHLALHPSEKYITYVTETGKRLMRFDIVNNTQMTDLAVVPGDDLYDRRWYIALAYLRDGRLLVTRGDTVDLFDEAGTVLRTYDLKECGYGFAQITVTSDQKFALAANIFTGVMCKFDLESGAIVGKIQTDHGGARRSLAGVAEFPG